MSSISVVSNPINLTVENENIALSVVNNPISFTVTNNEIEFIAVSAPINLVVEYSAIEFTVTSNPVVIEFNTGNVTITNNGGGKLTTDFDYTNYASTLLIGSIPENSLIVNTVIEINTAFDAGSLTVGKSSAQGILMAISDRGNAADRYLVNNYLETDSTENYNLYFSGSPTQGSGKIFITYI